MKGIKNMAETERIENLEKRIAALELALRGGVKQVNQVFNFKNQTDKDTIKRLQGSQFQASL